MMENSQEDINKKLDDILGQLQTSRQEVDSLVQDKFIKLRDSVNRAEADIVKLKADKDFVWKREGHRIQYNFNCETLENIKQMTFALEYEKLDYMHELLATETKRIEHRNKLIKLADSSDGGWETVRQYDSNDLASNSDDDRRISRAETRAMKKLDRKKPKGSRFTPYKFSKPTATVTQATTGGGAYPSGSSQARLFRGGLRNGTCFACGDISHWRRDCPYLVSKSVTSGVRSGNKGAGTE